jgi:hypothetical protein
LVGVQLEVIDGEVGTYIAIESPLKWQGRTHAQTFAYRWLSEGAAQRIRKVDQWVSAPVAEPYRRQRYLKFTQIDGDWRVKLYAGTTTAFLEGP